MSAASALMLATEASRTVAARRIFILEDRRICLKSGVVVLDWLLFEIYELYGWSTLEHVLVMVDLGLAREGLDAVDGPLHFSQQDESLVTYLHTLSLEVQRMT